RNFGFSDLAIDCARIACAMTSCNSNCCHFFILLNRLGFFKKLSSWPKARIIFVVVYNSAINSNIANSNNSLAVIVCLVGTK
ncbi:hypothetical protein, partial [Psychrobacter sp.]|uniref:hypothetical protein n=1 Tax=Psychrobacter sp. TaxID=56811 RepID=UPI0025D318AF